ncbi:isopentenyl-diphosphate Delta-isomerase [Dyadobacter sp. Leaf189]|uniref:isopentenyl-diphosphate Delta-isomerase n=1 Tax=Dyadobacter sp. Leaf189 TaxID=1736295 RepID=UPI0006F8F6C6|nr:isopentenyl-diphosphate Delta-isomerase [Dyadobacter sp. Leaf189]KQS27698.1 isopentenyl-diphosphate delta-isomerase [Dyadobacter sp. Leaf189]
MEDQVILVNEEDVEIGLMPKLEAHQKGMLHRAFSVFIFNTKGEMLLQRRAFGKYHSEGLWSNTCCSHPFPEESANRAASRRLREEMGISADLNFLYTFQYRVQLENGLTENELDHVFWGISDEKPLINTDEVSEYKYMTMNDVKADLILNPGNYTEWFKICFAAVAEQLKLKI